MAKDKAKATVKEDMTPKMKIEKYFKSEDPKIHAYTRAALVVDFHGIMKTVAEWKATLEQYVGV